VGGKPRVHQLAKELGVPAREVLAWLSDAGEFTKSASSTVEHPVARRLRAHYAAKSPAAARRGATTAGVSSNPFATTSVARPAPKGDESSLLRRSLAYPQEETIRRRFRKASSSGQDRASIDRLYLECQEQYGVSRDEVRTVIESDLLHNPGAYAVPKGATAVQRSGRHGDTTARGASRSDAIQASRPRPRTDTLAPGVDVANLLSVVDLITNLDAAQDDPDEVGACVRAFTPGAAGRYGYLGWRYAAAHRRAYPELSTRTPHHDVAVIAHVVETEKQVLDQITRAHAPFLDQPDLARRAVEAEFRELIDVDDVGRSAADEQRRVRDRDQFLRRAVVLTIANPEGDQRLWDMIDQIRPPALDQLVEINPPLESAIARLSDRIAAVETLLAADQDVLDQFFRQSHTELVDLQAGRYDFLSQFHDIAPSSVTTPRRTISHLAFALLPSGVKLRAFLDGIRSAGRYRGYPIDDDRLTVLEELESHFGAQRCRWHKGTESSSGVNSEYLVLSIKPDNGIGEHAVAISPLAGRHATYVVRADCADTDWATIFANSKSEARMQGARKLLFTATEHGTDQYRAMADKVITLLQCPRHEFLNRR
jgi:hypothetical protein